MNTILESTLMYVCHEFDTCHPDNLLEFANRAGSGHGVGCDVDVEPGWWGLRTFNEWTGCDYLVGSFATMGELLESSAAEDAGGAEDGRVLWMVIHVDERYDRRAWPNSKWTEITWNDVTRALWHSIHTGTAGELELEAVRKWTGESPVNYFGTAPDNWPGYMRHSLRQKGLL